MRYSAPIKPLLVVALTAAATPVLGTPVRAGNVQLPLNHVQPSLASDKNPFTREFDAYITTLLDEWKVAGLAIGVVDAHESHVKVRPGRSWNTPDTEQALHA